MSRRAVVEVSPLIHSTIDPFEADLCPCECADMPGSSGRFLVRVGMSGVGVVCSSGWSIVRPVGCRASTWKTLFVRYVPNLSRKY